MSTTRMFSRTAIAALAIVSLAACGKDNDDANTAATTDTTSMAAAPTPPPPQWTDGNILAAMVAGDSMDILAGNALKTTAMNPALKSYGNMLVADHSQHIKDVEALAKKDSLTIEPMAGDTSAAHRDNMKTMMAGMTKSASSDSTFVQNAIDGHQAMLDKLDDFDGKTQNADVKALIAATKPVVKKHLDGAKKIKDDMDKAKK